jgi:hypothetical protein
MCGKCGILDVSQPCGLFGLLQGWLKFSYVVLIAMCLCGFCSFVCFLLFERGVLFCVTYVFLCDVYLHSLSYQKRVGD